MDERNVREIVSNALAMSDYDADTDEEWDSLGHIAILVALDTAFDGKISRIEELQDAYSVTAILDILRAKGLIA